MGKRKQADKIRIVVFVTSLILVRSHIGLAQNVPIIETPPQPSVEDSVDGLFFADVLVRGRPIFQVGSLPELDATERAQIINRRIASVLARSQTIETVTVQTSPQRNIATLQVNNRVLMTVTQQDAEDFGASVEELAQQWANELNQAFDQPPLAIDVVQRVNITMRELTRDIIDNLPSIIGGLIVVALTWGIARGVRQVAYGWAQRTEGDRSTEILIAKLGYGGVWVIGSIIALGVLGLDFTALLGTLGLTTVAIGFSLRDILGNYISGVILLAARPFRLGDQVVIKEFEGTITQIQLRATTIQTYDGRMVYVPNQEVFQASITNNTASPVRRSSVMVGIDYAADINTAKQIIRDTISKISGVEVSQPIDILVRELAPSTVNLEIRFWVNSRRMAFLEATSQVAQAIKESLMNAGIALPTDIYAIEFRNSLPILQQTVLEQPNRQGSDK
ncbi:mechanosensitive ion channel family protein [Gloeocapsopsis crepidinum LEGE 06123]|uniref:Mechanosensitive ion channel family protein n=1 Tax=Gloeocapsopsis crepidinum LEGE 06123 TaxID=588587 RepID=A0ABR9ULE5_9CHRO|nr:mechanosensitive ion channel family protein [Gloeocapsopsis crepidinum]MBE9189102.1 mechanosensitive ion channel family protein [Gloeocapsopsis crepidinum LEGE 06123]